MVVGSEFLEVGRMAESTKGVEENDKGIEGEKRRYRRKRGNAEWRQETREGGGGGGGGGGEEREGGG
ncbi:hypothetical protein ALC60_12481 [Trachymyrmex zeteki]|uniref:Uncharacterized protein n=1 Tax=Mycetomoellerius zeteki TaxID=64791 RepID=A0A151WL67_9HYME|nr:hypothetical protein ALC60_12481 [Trachymyrmex zeteki]